MEKATRRHFFDHGKEGHQDEKDNCHWCQLRSFPTHGTIPITVVNEISDEVLPRNFRFIDRMVHGDGVEAAEYSFRSGCSCGGHGAQCQFSNCLCLADLEDEDSDHDSDDNGQEQRKAYAYHSHGDKAGLLRSRLLDSAIPLYECHPGCLCSASCPNRVVERGRTVPLQIFRTTDRGWGKSYTVDSRERCPQVY